MFYLKPAFASLLLLVALGSSGPACAHAAMKQASPSARATLDVAPSEVILEFNEKLEGAFSAIRLLDVSGKDVTTAKARLDPSNAAVLRLPAPALKSGTYTVRWTAVGPDGHPRTGEYTFAVK